VKTEMSNDADDSFLERWSKRKHAVRRGETPSEPARSEASPPESAPPRDPAPAAPPELPPVDSLRGLESEYKDFLRPDVDPATKSAALRKLFGDPHFNQMDGLDIYIDDYTKEDPIPPAMLRALNQARSLGLFDDEEKGQTTAAPEPAEPAAVAATDGAEPPAIEAPQPAADAGPQPAVDVALQPPAPAKPDTP
jgi:Protein of unknown function (DUF3306)